MLNPWPSWEMQEVGVEGDLQNCQSMTIDSQGRMWYGVVCIVFCVLGYYEKFNTASFVM